jgi:ribosomal protein S18 acetylase RimI-like enzyme
MSVREERAAGNETNVLEYLERDIIRNALDIWIMRHDPSRYQLHLCRVNDEPKAHLGICETPEANYTSLGGTAEAASSLLHLIPSRGAITVAPNLSELVRNNLKYDIIYPNDIMMVVRGEEKLKDPELARQLTVEDAAEYSTFGSSFNSPEVPIEWTQERLEKDLIFGAFLEGKLASVASVSAWLPQMAVILGVETKREFRRKGLASSVVSAAVCEALRRSESCSLFVRSDNEEAKSLYRRIGFRKVGEELWVDIGTGMIP